MNQLYYSFVSVVSPVETPFHNLHEVFNCFSTPAVTPHPMEAETNPGPSLVESFKLAFDDSETADVKFLVEGREINAHRALLKIRCQHFRSMFQVCPIINVYAHVESIWFPIGMRSRNLFSSFGSIKKPGFVKRLHDRLPQAYQTDLTL